MPIELTTTKERRDAVPTTNGGSPPRVTWADAAVTEGGFGDKKQPSQISPTTDGGLPSRVTSSGAAVIEQDFDDRKEEEHNELMDAISRSRTEVVALSPDGVVLLRLARMARSPKVLEVLLISPMLEECRNRAVEAGCEVAPKGRLGPKFFVPHTDAQAQELSDAGFELLDHHILALNTDTELIEQALQSLPRTQRPRLSAAHPGQVFEEQRCCPGQEDELRGSNLRENDECEEEEELESDSATPMVVVEHAFSTDSSLGFAEWRSHEEMP